MLRSLVMGGPYGCRRLRIWKLEKSPSRAAQENFGARWAGARSKPAVY